MLATTAALVMGSKNPHGGGSLLFPRSDEGCHDLVPVPCEFVDWARGARRGFWRRARRLVAEMVTLQAHVDDDRVPSTLLLEVQATLPTWASDEDAGSRSPLRYLPPELVRDEKETVVGEADPVDLPVRYSRGFSDVFMAGSVLFALLSGGATPRDAIGLGATRNDYVCGLRTLRIPTVDRHVERFVRRLLHPHPQRRPRACDLARELGIREKTLPASAERCMWTIRTATLRGGCLDGLGANVKAPMRGPERRAVEDAAAHAAQLRGGYVVDAGDHIAVLAMDEDCEDAMLSKQAHIGRFYPTCCPDGARIAEALRVLRRNAYLAGGGDSDTDSENAEDVCHVPRDDGTVHPACPASPRVGERTPGYHDPSSPCNCGPLCGDAPCDCGATGGTPSDARLLATTAEAARATRPAEEPESDADSDEDKEESDSDDADSDEDKDEDRDEAEDADEQQAYSRPALQRYEVPAQPQQPQPAMERRRDSVASSASAGSSASGYSDNTVFAEPVISNRDTDIALLVPEPCVSGGAPCAEPCGGACGDKACRTACDRGGDVLPRPYERIVCEDGVRLILQGMGTAVPAWALLDPDPLRLRPGAQTESDVGELRIKLRELENERRLAEHEFKRTVETLQEAAKRDGEKRGAMQLELEELRQTTYALREARIDDAQAQAQRHDQRLDSDRDRIRALTVEASELRAAHECAQRDLDSERCETRRLREMMARVAHHLRAEFSDADPAALVDAAAAAKREHETLADVLNVIARDLHTGLENISHRTTDAEVRAVVRHFSERIGQSRAVEDDVCLVRDLVAATVELARRCELTCEDDVKDQVSKEEACARAARLEREMEAAREELARAVAEMEQGRVDTAEAISKANEKAAETARRSLKLKQMEEDIVEALDSLTKRRDVAVDEVAKWEKANDILTKRNAELNTELMKRKGAVERAARAQQELEQMRQRMAGVAMDEATRAQTFRLIQEMTGIVNGLLGTTAEISKPTTLNEAMENFSREPSMKNASNLGSKLIKLFGKKPGEKISASGAIISILFTIIIVVASNAFLAGTGFNPREIFNANWNLSILPPLAAATLNNIIGMVRDRLPNIRDINTREGVFNFVAIVLEVITLSITLIRGDVLSNIVLAMTARDFANRILEFMTFIPKSMRNIIRDAVIGFATVASSQVHESIHTFISFIGTYLSVLIGVPGGIISTLNEFSKLIWKKVTDKNFVSFMHSTFGFSPSVSYATNTNGDLGKTVEKILTMDPKNLGCTQARLANCKDAPKGLFSTPDVAELAVALLENLTPKELQNIQKLSFPTTQSKDADTQPKAEDYTTNDLVEIDNLLGDIAPVRTAARDDDDDREYGDLLKRILAAGASARVPA
jgi:hypothetical protein